MNVIDCHVHLGGIEHIDNLVSVADSIGIGRMNLVSEIHSARANMNPESFAAKAMHPERFYVFAGLDHSGYLSGGLVSPPPLAEQVDVLIAAGADGLKMLETKPVERKMLPIRADDDYFEHYFARVEQSGFPILWHVADPEEFWDPETTPKWARERGWGYDESYVAKEQFYTEVEHVLERHPRLKVVFAHFFFLSADLDRASALLDRFGGVNLDLAPGIELLYNMSRDVDGTREFFTRYADRIMFGTDLFGDCDLPCARARSGIVRRWLETGDEFRLPEEADFLLGPPEDGVMVGLALPGEVLRRIYAANFEGLAGPRPRKLDRELAARECDRLAEQTQAMVPDSTAHGEPAAIAARMLRG